MLTDILVHRFVKEPDNVKNPKIRYSYGKLAGGTGLACNVLLFAAKLLIGWLSGSVAIIADAFNNLSDAGSCIVTLVGFRLSSTPADEEHPFGHGRIEYLSAMGVAVLIMIAGFELASSAVSKILAPQAAEFSVITMLILLLAIGVKLWMALFFRRLGKRINSETLTASGIDSRNDVLCTGVVLLTSLLSWTTGWIIDGYVGLIVALFVMWSGFSIIREAVSPLLGQAPDPELVKGIEESVLEHDGIVGIHDLMIHNYGPGRVIVSLHAEVPVKQDILISHDIVDCIEQELMHKYNIISCIHMDPVDTENEEVARLKMLAEDCLHEVNPQLQLHDFRMVTGETHTNLIFDVVVPFHCPDESTMAVRIQECIHSRDSKLYAVIKLENSYI